jgi:hypothetical protein
MLFMGKRRRFAGRTRRHQPVDAAFYLKINKVLKVVVSDFSLSKRRHERSESAGEGAQIHVGM